MSAKPCRQIDGGRGFAHPTLLVFAMAIVRVPLVGQVAELSIQRLMLGGDRGIDLVGFHRTPIGVPYFQNHAGAGPTRSACLLKVHGPGLCQASRAPGRHWAPSIRYSTRSCPTTAGQKLARVRENRGQCALPRSNRSRTQAQWPPPDHSMNLGQAPGSTRSHFTQGNSAFPTVGFCQNIYRASCRDCVDTRPGKPAAAGPISEGRNTGITSIRS